MKRIFIAAVLTAALVLTGCQAANTNATSSETAATTQAVTQETTAAATTAAETTAAATTKAPREKLLPLAENTSGKVQIQTVSGSVTYKYNSLSWYWAKKKKLNKILFLEGQGIKKR